MSLDSNECMHKVEEVSFVCMYRALLSVYRVLLSACTQGYFVFICGCFECVGLVVIYSYKI